MNEAEHILIVEDEPITREQLVSYFEDEGFRVSSTDSGDEVQNIVKDSRTKGQSFGIFHFTGTITVIHYYSEAF